MVYLMDNVMVHLMDNSMNNLINKLMGAFMDNLMDTTSCMKTNPLYFWGTLQWPYLSIFVL